MTFSSVSETYTHIYLVDDLWFVDCASNCNRANSASMEYVMNHYDNVFSILFWLHAFVAAPFKFIQCDNVRVCSAGGLDIQCPVEHVIVTSSATFGRMEYNECILVKDLIGCQNDVLFVVDRWCSGRQICRINSPADELERTNNNCLAYLRKYLQISYSCLKVTQIGSSECNMPMALTTQEGIVSSRVYKDAGCGSSRSPWVISGLPGQRIKLAIIDFGSEIVKLENKTGPYSRYGYIQDGREKIEFHADVERERFLYESKTNKLEIELENADNTPGFLIKFQKIGCADLTPPAHAWYKRDGDQAVIGCEWSQKTWHLSCDGRSWSGVVGNCSELATQEPILMHKERSLSPALWLVCVVSVSVVLMVAACVIGIVCIKKYRIKQDVQKSMTLERIPGQGHYDLDPNIEMASMLYLPYKLSADHEQQQQQGTLSDPHRPTSYLIPQDQVMNELTPIRIWERPLPDLPDKPLASDTTETYPGTKRGRTPGDGDEAVGVCGLKEGGTLQSHESTNICT